VVIVAAICVCFEAFFSGSEIAMVSASRARLRHLAKAGDHGAQEAEKFLAEPQTLLATTLMGTNLATVTFSVTVALALLGRDTSNSELLAIVLVSPMTLIFGELVPKTLFQRHADTIVPRIIYPLRFASIVLRPGVWVMGAFAALVTRVLGVDRERAFVTKDELAMLIESEAKGETDITNDEREMISNVLELSDTEVENVMVPLSEVTALPVDASIAEATLEVADKQHSRIPIYEDRIDNIVGVLHVFDLLQAKNGELLVAELARVVPFVPENQPCIDLLLDLKHAGDPMAVVVDEYGGAVGIVTVEDILEEVVGEIDDEYDTGPPPIQQERAGVWRAEARTSVERINEELDLDLPESEDYESIAGLVLDRFKRIPEPGESIVLGSVTIRVLEASERAVETVQILRVRKR
jgi:CBS domain containing-hemolysin-like protein